MDIGIALIFFTKFWLLHRKFWKYLVEVFTAAATAAADRQPLHGELMKSAGAFEAGRQRRFAPEVKTKPFFKNYGWAPNIFTKFRGLLTLKSKNANFSSWKRLLSQTVTDSTIPQTPTKKYGYGDVFKKKRSQFFLSNSRNWIFVFQNNVFFFLWGNSIFGQKKVILL